DVEPEADPVALPQERSTDPDAVRAALQRVMSSDCGVVRDADVLQRASDTIGDLAHSARYLRTASTAGYEVINLLRVSRTIVASATARRESRGSHTRRYFPDSSDALLGRFVALGGDAPVFVALPEVVA